MESNKQELIFLSYFWRETSVTYVNAKKKAQNIVSLYTERQSDSMDVRLRYS